jgi:archaetidylinositol phosphate synthase
MPDETRETRIHESLLAGAEKRLLVRIAGVLPARVHSDHLTALGAAAMVAAGLGYAVAPVWPGALVAVVIMLAVNWFGDSLDGTLARVRQHERPRFGFYVDHVLDAVGVACLTGGLVAGGFLSVLPAAVFLGAYYLLMIEIALATHALGTFTISYFKLGPTELRILLAIGTLYLLRSPSVVLGEHSLLLFDVGATAGALVLLVTFINSAVRNTHRLYRLEPLPATSARRTTIHLHREPGAET